MGKQELFTSPLLLLKHLSITSLTSHVLLGPQRYTAAPGQLLWVGDHPDGEAQLPNDIDTWASRASRRPRCESDTLGSSLLKITKCSTCPEIQCHFGAEIPSPALAFALSLPFWTWVRNPSSRLSLSFSTLCSVIKVTPYQKSPLQPPTAIP